MASDVLIVDDEADIRMLISGILEDEGYSTRAAANSDEAFDAVQERRPDLIILDIWLQNSKLDGLEILEVVARQHPQVPIVMISGHGNIETAVAAIKKGAYDFIEKPFKADELLLVVQRALEAAELRRENEELRLRTQKESELVGNSASIIQVRQAVEKVAPTGSRVLITGPAGAGKEVVARLIHAQSRRAKGPFVILNCAALNADRIEEELFGVEGEAPEERRTGHFERAHGGTLVLDEVADMPLETQGKIVRALQEQTFTRVGGERRVQVDVRVLATSNRDLQGLMTEGTFRQDLYYRLAVVPVEVASLQERREDIPLLAIHFMNRSAEASGMPVRRYADDAIASLQAYDWPGNVRELRNVVDWLLIMAPGNSDDPIRSEHLPQSVTGGALGAVNVDTEMMSMPLREAREAFERHYLGLQVKRFGGNISKTAEFVGMERSALHRKLRSLGVATADK